MSGARGCLFSGGLLEYLWSGKGFMMAFGVTNKGDTTYATYIMLQ